MVEKWRNVRKDAVEAVDKLCGVIPELSTVYTDEGWMKCYPQNVHMNWGDVCTEMSTGKYRAIDSHRRVYSLKTLAPLGFS